VDTRVPERSSRFWRTGISCNGLLRGGPGGTRAIERRRVPDRGDGHRGRSRLAGNRNADGTADLVANRRRDRRLRLRIHSLDDSHQGRPHWRLHAAGTARAMRREATAQSEPQLPLLEDCEWKEGAQFYSRVRASDWSTANPSAALRGSVRRAAMARPRSACRRLAKRRTAPRTGCIRRFSTRACKPCWLVCPGIGRRRCDPPASRLSASVLSRVHPGIAYSTGPGKAGRQFLLG